MEPHWSFTILKKVSLQVIGKEREVKERRMMYVHERSEGISSTGISEREFVHWLLIAYSTLFQNKSTKVSHGGLIFLFFKMARFIKKHLVYKEI